MKRFPEGLQDKDEMLDCLCEEAFLQLHEQKAEETSQALWAGIHRLTTLLITHPRFPFVDRERLIGRAIEILAQGVSLDRV